MIVCVCAGARACVCVPVVCHNEKKVSDEWQAQQVITPMYFKQVPASTTQ